MAGVVDDVVFNYLTSGLAAGQFISAKTGVNVVAVTPANLAATQAAIAALAAALLNLTLGTVKSSNIVISTGVDAATPAVTANRGNKWAVSCQESTGDLNKFTITIPAADDSKAIAGTINYDPANAAWTAFDAAFSGKFYSPAGLPLTFIGAKLVGRRR